MLGDLLEGARPSAASQSYEVRTHFLPGVFEELLVQDLLVDLTELLVVWLFLYGFPAVTLELLFHFLFCVPEAEANGCMLHWFHCLRLYFGL